MPMRIYSEKERAAIRSRGGAPNIDTANYHEFIEECFGEWLDVLGYDAVPPIDMYVRWTHQYDPWRRGLLDESHPAWRPEYAAEDLPMNRFYRWAAENRREQYLKRTEAIIELDRIPVYQYANLPATAAPAHKKLTASKPKRCSPVSWSQWAPRRKPKPKPKSKPELFKPEVPRRQSQTGVSTLYMALGKVARSESLAAEGRQQGNLMRIASLRISRLIERRLELDDFLDDRESW